VRYSTWIVFAAVAAVGCHASVKGQVNAGGEEHVEGQADVDESPAESAASASSASEVEVAGSAPQALLGARHDLRLAASQKAAVCSCLAVRVGPPTSNAFAWESTPPVTDPDTELVIALSSEGVPCAEQPKDSLGASYWGYRMRHGDVIVEVENARFGRPVTSGAIIPRPAEGGHVYVRPTSKSVPYGRSLNKGERTCKVF
jgi:hypothetical protein